MIGSLKNWGLAGLLAAALILGLGLKISRGRIEGLKAEKAALETKLNQAAAELEALKKAYGLALSAAQAQESACRANLSRRDQAAAILEEAPAAPAGARPSGVIDDQTSRELVVFINSQLFSSWVRGGPAAGAGTGPLRPPPAASTDGPGSGPASGR